jgi:hypothetical protein
MNTNELIGTYDVLMVTLDSLRYDVAQEALEKGMTPRMGEWLPNGKWEKRHSPGSFTYSAHHAFFAGFLPTPVTGGPHSRLFAVTFPGSESISGDTCIFDEPDIISGFAARGYHTVCIGGVGFFNLKSPLGSVLPDMFAESHWTEEFGVTHVESTKHQVTQALRSLSKLKANQRVFLFINVSATHQPSCIFLPGAKKDTNETQAAALAHADLQLGSLFKNMRKRAPVLCIICSDHGTIHDDNGFTGHRVGHPLVWTVPYAEFILPRPQVDG